MEMSKDKSEFRMLLQKEFVERCRKNSSYSLRAFARSLGVEASPLSAMLRGKRPITKKMRERLGLALGMKLEELNERASHQRRKNDGYQQITLDTYAIISDWYHYAILELIRAVDFKPDCKYLAKTLGISQTEVRIAVERLQRVGLLKIKPDGSWVDTSKNARATNINGNLTSKAARNLQRQVLEMSIRALEEVPVDLRSHTSMTMAVNPEDLDEAREIIKNFRRDLCNFFERNKKPTRVYHLGVSLYPVTANSNKEIKMRRMK